MCTFFVRMRRFLLTLDTIAILCYVYSNLCKKEWYLKSENYKFQTLYHFFLQKVKQTKHLYPKPTKSMYSNKKDPHATTIAHLYWYFTPSQAILIQSLRFFHREKQIFEINPISRRIITPCNGSSFQFPPLLRLPAAFTSPAFFH